MKLILNADDFGLTERVNLAIVDCFKMGAVCSTTIMMNQPGTQHAIDLYHHGVIPEVGLHFTVTSGKPLLPPEQVASLVDDKGYFLDKAILFSKWDVSPDEVALELKAQYQAAIDAGLKINHIDSHHFGGVFQPLKEAFTRVVNEIGLPVRRIDTIIEGQHRLNVATPDAFDLRFFDDGATTNQLKHWLLEHKAKTPNGIIEFMCHPALQGAVSSHRDSNAEILSDNVDHELAQLSSYTHKRIEEWKILTDPAFKTWLDEQGIECVGFDTFH